MIKNKLGKKKRIWMSEPAAESVVAINEEEMMQLMANSGAMGPGPAAPLGVEADENRVYFYSNVGEKEVFELVKLLRSMDVEMQSLSMRLGIEPIPIQLHIHSAGGDLFSGLAAIDTIRTLKTPIHTYVQGSVASAATLMSICGTKRYMYSNSLMLIHQISTSMMYGKYHEFLDEIENQNLLMEKVKDIYKAKTNLTEEQLNDMLQHDLWLSSDKCLELGLVDEIL
jgi:ATP-dependent protease ClpP protease subunit